MKLIADSGSTKTKWFLQADSKLAESECKTAGINPFFQQSSDIVKTLQQEFTLDHSQVESIHFYGAGAANDSKKRELFEALHAYFQTDHITIDSDLVAAAHSLCGRQEGVVAILGTGSNSCYYDGEKIVHNVSPLGFILGDEGSGAVLGRKLLSEVLKKQFPDHLIRLFFDTYKVNAVDVLENVYRKPFPNRYLAAYTRFLSAHIKDEAVHHLVLQSFVEFFQRNISAYERATDLPVHFTGSIAWHFADVLKQAAEEMGFRAGKIVQDPMEGLKAYHSQL